MGAILSVVVLDYQEKGAYFTPQHTRRASVARHAILRRVFYFLFYMMEKALSAN